MMTQFASADEMAISIEESKFPSVVVPSDWKFGGTVHMADEPATNVLPGKMWLIIKGKRFEIIELHHTYYLVKTGENQ